MARYDMVKIVNDIGDEHMEAEVQRSSLPAWERNGWTAVEDGSSEGQPAVQVDMQPPPQAPVETKVQPDPNSKE